MKVVIDIDDDLYKEYVCVQFARGNGKTIVYNLLKAIKKGKPLPEHHGRLIDADKLIRDTIKNPVHAPDIHIIDIKNAPTIIERGDSE